MKSVSLLGSTGSIGTQTLDVIRKNNDIKVVALAAGTRVKELAEQAREFKPQLVSVKTQEKAKELKANISVITKYYNQGKTLSLKVWNNAMLGEVENKFEYDLSVGDRIIDTLKVKGFKDKFIKERYMIDAMTMLAKHKPQGAETAIGIEDTIEIVKSLDEDTVKFISNIATDKLNEIYSALLQQYIEKHGVIDKAA